MKEELTLTNTQREVLQIITKRATSPQRLVKRAGILLDYDQVRSQVEVAAQRKIHREMVARWLNRWEEYHETLEKTEHGSQESELSLGDYERAIKKILADAPRPGTPVTISEAQKQQILALATSAPEQEGVPLTHWTHETLAQEVVRKQIVPQISPSHLGRFLKECRITTAPKPVLGRSPH